VHQLGIGHKQLRLDIELIDFLFDAVTEETLSDEFLLEVVKFLAYLWFFLQDDEKVSENAV
jgi:hypothetical protein